LKSSRTTYFDSLTGITGSESGKSSEALKITGLPELITQNRNCASDGNAVLTTIRYYGSCRFLRRGAAELMTQTQPEPARERARAGRSGLQKY
jgi:hypothetical protein